MVVDKAYGPFTAKEAGRRELLMSANHPIYVFEVVKLVINIGEGA